MNASLRKSINSMKLKICLLGAVAFLLAPVTSHSQLTEPERVYLVLGGPDASGLYHREGCPLLSKGGPLSFMSTKEAKARYFQPHCSCMVGRDAEPPCAALTATLDVSPSGVTSKPSELKKFVGLTTAEVLKLLGPPSLIQKDTWYYDKTGLQLQFVNGRVSDSEAKGGATPANLIADPKVTPEGVPSTPAGATAQCRDGTYSYSKSRSGTCSGHGGVARWISG